METLEVFFLIEDNQRALIYSSYSVSHFTILRFTNACSEAVCCVIIFATHMVEAKHILGIQPFANIEGDPTINLEANSNKVNKYYPHRPTCSYDSKEIAMCIMCSENGSITTEILADIMHYLNEELTFDRDDATPYLLLDGHGSQFRLPFLEYINDD